MQLLLHQRRSRSDRDQDPTGVILVQRVVDFVGDVSRHIGGLGVSTFLRDVVLQAVRRLQSVRNPAPSRLSSVAGLSSLSKDFPGNIAFCYFPFPRRPAGQGLASSLPPSTNVKMAWCKTSFSHMAGCLRLCYRVPSSRGVVAACHLSSAPLLELLQPDRCQLCASGATRDIHAMRGLRLHAAGFRHGRHSTARKLLLESLRVLAQAGLGASACERGLWRTAFHHVWLPAR